MAIGKPFRVADLDGNCFDLGVRTTDAVGPNGIPGCVDLGAVDGKIAGDGLGEGKLVGVGQAVGGAQNSRHAVDHVPHGAAVIAGEELAIEADVDENLSQVVEVLVDRAVFVFDL